MKTLKIAVLTAALIAPIAGTATATAATYPVKDEKLTANPLYAAGALPKAECAEHKMRRGDRLNQARKYLDGVIGCLEKTWQQHLAGAGLTYKKVKVEHVKKFPKKWCEFETGKIDSQGYYCAETGTIAFQVGKTWLDDASDLWMFHFAGYMYGHHVQSLVGIERAYQDAPYRNKSELNEQIRRRSLQAECLSGAFTKSVWPMKGRTAKDWKKLLSVQEGDARGEVRELGTTSNIRHWIKQGYATGDPKSCNTWAAPSAKVA
ncbi:neutral zinc metallopeptidase [Nonomuraea sp. NPDC050404]|uniref:neutral zinc metallopeptidase n=1 Tax=Nonomuraea sp. NPDC050404 TaxID=3155783 RepID=UPI0033C3340C